MEPWNQADFAHRIIDGSPAIPAGISNSKDAPPLRRFGVYRNNVRSALGEALAVRYPVVQRLVGEEFFSAMAGIFALKNLPKSPVLIDYGKSFPDFIAAFAPAQSLPYLADVAHLESAYWQAYHAADAAPLASAEFSAVDPGSRFDMLPSFAIVQSRHPIVAIWRTNTDDAEVEAVDMNIGEDALIVRPYLDVEVRCLPAGAADFLTSLQQGAMLGEAAAAAVEVCPDFDLAVNLSGLMQARVVKGIRS